MLFLVKGGGRTIRQAHQYSSQVLFSHLKRGHIARRTYGSPFHGYHWRKFMFSTSCSSLSVVVLSWAQPSPTMFESCHSEFWPSHLFIHASTMSRLICTTSGIVPKFSEVLCGFFHNKTQIFSSFLSLSRTVCSGSCRKQLKLLKWVSFTEQSCTVLQQRLELYRKHSIQLTGAWELSSNTFN